MSQIPIGWWMEGLYLYPLLLKVMIDGIPKRSIFTNRTIWGWWITSPKTALISVGDEISPQFCWGETVGTSIPTPFQGKISDLQTDDQQGVPPWRSGNLQLPTLGELTKKQKIAQICSAEKGILVVIFQQEKLDFLDDSQGYNYAS